jgi:hypothetical protein
MPISMTGANCRRGHDEGLAQVTFPRVGAYLREGNNARQLLRIVEKDRGAARSLLEEKSL